MGSKEEKIEKIERKEILRDKSLLDGPLLASNNTYEDPLTDFQLHYPNIGRHFYLWERGKLNINNSPQVLQGKE
ncbi:hypothetical protein J1N35_037652, partial [Gossypium stocksii]